MSSEVPSSLRPVSIAREGATADHWADIEIVTVAYKSAAPLERLLSALPRELHVIVVDNSPEVEDLTDLIGSRPRTTYLRSGGNPGFGAACNLGVQESTRPYIVFLNPDTQPSWAMLQRLKEVLRGHPEASSCGPLLVGADGRAQRGAGGWQPTTLRCLAHAVALDHVLPASGIWLKKGAGTHLDVEWLAGTCLAVRRDAFLQAGGFDPTYFLYQEDMDLGRRFRLYGYRQVLCCDVTLAHEGGASSPTEQRISLWRHRGRALRKYLRAHGSFLGARLMPQILAAGYAARAAIFAVAGMRHKQSEMMTYATALIGRSHSDPRWRE